LSRANDILLHRLRKSILINFGRQLWRKRLRKLELMIFRSKKMKFVRKFRPKSTNTFT
jgi:hypothetical protein